MMLLGLVESNRDAPTQFRSGDHSTVNRESLDTTDLTQRHEQVILPRIAGKLADQQRRAHHHLPN
jgi:hypothetical protein